MRQLSVIVTIAFLVCMSATAIAAETKFKVLCASAHDNPAAKLNAQIAAIPNVKDVSQPAISSEGEQSWGYVCVTVRYEE